MGRAAGRARRRPRPAAPPAAVTGSLPRALLWLVLWLLPLPILCLAGQTLLFDLAAFFARLAVVTFGGAYAVLAYMAQEVVQTRGWLTPGQMVDALGLAETTPGPLILVTQFVGMLAGHAQGGVGLALAAGLLTLWMTFVPCFLWIFAFAPHVEALLARPRLQGALAGITAAVVGVIANLSLWFAIHVLFARTAEARFGPVSLLLPELQSLRAGRAGAERAGAGPAFRPGTQRSACPFGGCGGGLDAGGDLTKSALSLAVIFQYGGGAIPGDDLNVRRHRLRKPHAPRHARAHPGGAGGRRRGTAFRATHHFFITFDTGHPDVEIADWLSDRYPSEMTVVMQHWFDDLEVSDDGFSVTLNFGDEPEPLYIPYDAIKTFVDPSVEFGLRFETQDER